MSCVKARVFEAWKNQAQYRRDFARHVDLKTRFFGGTTLGSSKGCAPLGPDKGSKGATDEACKNSQNSVTNLGPYRFLGVCFRLSHVEKKKTMKHLV